MCRSFFVLLIFLTLSLSSFLSASPNDLPPYFKSSSVIQTTQQSTPDKDYVGLARLTRHLQKTWQQNLHRQLRQFRHSFSHVWLVTLFSVAFLYGILHALGPGHGKALLSTYLIHNRGNRLAVVKISGLVALIHTGGAVLIGIILQTILLSFRGLSAQMAMQRYFSLASGLFVMSIGLWLFYQNTRRQREETFDTPSQNFWSVGVAAGMVPCPVALTIMMLSISYGLFGIGLVAVLGVSLGMAVLLTAIGLLVIQGREKLQSAFAQGSSEKTRQGMQIMRYFSSGLMILLGLITVALFY